MNTNIPEIMVKSLDISKIVSSTLFKEIDDTSLNPFDKIICTIATVAIVRRLMIDSIHNSISSIDSIELSELLMQVEEAVNVLMTQK